MPTFYTACMPSWLDSAPPPLALPQYRLGTIFLSSFVSATLSLLTYSGFIFFMGKLSDKFGRKTMLITASIVFILATVPLFSALQGASFWAIVAIQIAFGFMLAMNDGSLPASLSELFPTDVPSLIPI